MPRRKPRSFRPNYPGRRVRIIRREAGSEAPPGAGTGGWEMRWEYRTLAFNVARGFFPFSSGGQVEGDEISGALNRLGAEGWELVSAFDTNDVSGQTKMVVCILK